MNTPKITPEEARTALKLPREGGLRSVVVNGLTISVCALKRIARSPSQDAQPIAPVVPPPRAPAAEKPDSETTESGLLGKFTRFEANAQPMKMPEHARMNGEHIKSYLVNYINRQGEFHCEKVAAKGIVTAITIFYIQHEETAIISVICVL